MFSTKRIFSIVSLCALFLVACSPEDGETGPAGPIGPEGRIGPKGDPGQDGTDGLDGAANISATTFTVNTADWTGLSNGSVVVFRDTLSVPEITQIVQDNGVVKVYRSIDSGINWLAMPYSNFAVNYIFSTYVGNVELEINRVDGAQPSLVNATFKVVVIPPAARISGVDYNNYEAVNAIYGIEKLVEGK